MNNKNFFFALVVLSFLFVTGCASLEMVYPNGGEHWEQGRTYTIRWVSRNIPGDVVVKLKGGTGQDSWYMACEPVSAEVGQCDYILPCDFGWRQATAHVMTLDGELSDQSDAPFSIAWPNVNELERHLRDLYAESPYFRENPRIAQASVQSFDRQTLFYFCSHLANLENTGETYVPKPLALQNCSVPTPCYIIELTDNEVQNIHAAKAAHAVWLDKHELVPWRLSKFSDAELRGLFDKQLLFEESISGNYYFGFSVVDHSPSEIYRYALHNQLVQGGPVGTLYVVLEDVRGKRQHPTFLHGAGHYDDPVTAYTLYEALTTYSDRGYGTYRISRYGCHSMARIVVGLLRSLNIPGETTTSGEWFDAPHSSAVWPALRRVMPHGDDVYGGSLSEVPTKEFLPTFGIYDHPTYTLVCGTDKPCISHRHRALLAITYPSRWVRRRCCNPDIYGYATCLEYLSSDYGDYLTEEEIAEAALRIEGLCQ